MPPHQQQWQLFLTLFLLCSGLVGLFKDSNAEWTATPDVLPPWTSRPRLANKQRAVHCRTWPPFAYDKAGQCRRCPSLPCFAPEPSSRTATVGALCGPRRTGGRNFSNFRLVAFCWENLRVVMVTQVVRGTRLVAPSAWQPWRFRPGALFTQHSSHDPKRAIPESAPHTTGSSSPCPVSAVSRMSEAWPLVITHRVFLFVQWMDNSFFFSTRASSGKAT